MEEPITQPNKNDIGFIILKLRETIDKLISRVEKLEQKVSYIEENKVNTNERRKPNGRSRN